ncbi:maltodextrin glucosidase [Vibrio ulleungensis]|uniref:Maltodextrin glucosidase n=1 Tax=Vibrio ulleungensis TaxID=2807619 RepID=A0ABS2HKR3_9VIBR|nr:maltodextrin glucosidase [Vibrio ulleungensis]MBM7036659.1 maltodextrin glucosidase [Vibrio ulleungensis]
MTAPFLHHASTCDGVTATTSTLRLVLQTKIDELLTVYVRIEPDNEEYLIEMTRGEDKGRLAQWSAEIPLNGDRDVTHYVFKAISATQQWWLDAQGIKSRMPPRELHFKYNADHQPVDWVSDQVFYQVFPDRFCNGDPTIGVTDGEYSIKHGTVPATVKSWDQAAVATGAGMSVEFYNGDLQGVAQKLDYLQALGITAVYMNPIFSSQTNHKYDTMDYYSVDPHLGTNQQLAELTSNIHQRGMKVVLDAVFNHTSVEHPWFDMSGRSGDGAYQSPSSPYRDYYLFEEDSQRYQGWKGVASLPVLNFENQGVRDAIYDADDAVMRYWLRPPYNIDGWRLDVVHMVGEGEGAKNNAHYVKEFRRVTKEENANAFVLGEHFFEASQWLQGDQEDGAMNYYGFAHPVRAYFAHKDIAYAPIQLSTQDFVDWLTEAKGKLPWANQLTQLNQLDSHDTARFLTMVNEDEAQQKLASVFLMTYVGTPCLYYGTEVGMVGQNDPDNRRPFPWHSVDGNPWLDFYQSLIAIRQSHAALRQGDIQFLVAQGQQLIYSRELKGEIVIVALNLAEQVQAVSIPSWKLGIEDAKFTSLLGDEEAQAVQGQIEMNLPAKGYRVLAMMD